MIADWKAAGFVSTLPRNNRCIRLQEELVESRNHISRIRPVHGYHADLGKTVFEGFLIQSLGTARIELTYTARHVSRQ